MPAAETEILSRLSEITGLLTRSPDEAAGDAEFRQKYLGHVAACLDQLELIGVRADYSPRTTLSVAYTSLEVATIRHRGSDRRGSPVPIAEWSEGDPDQVTMQVERALATSPSMLIRGEAGAGKSTLLRWIAVVAARAGFTGDLAEWNGRVPFLIKLRRHADGDLPGPEEFVRDVARPIADEMPSKWAHRQLRSGRALLLVDGVDELVGNQRRAVRPWLQSLLAEFPRIRVVVTSRPSAVSARWLEAEGFAPAFLRPLTPAGVSALIRQWHEAMRDAGETGRSAEELGTCERRLHAQLKAAAHLRVLATHPLLAAMLCALNLDRRTKLPEDRMALYEAVLDMLLYRRDAERDIPSSKEVTLESGQKLFILKALAWRLSSHGRAELDKDTARRQIEKQIETMPRVPSHASADAVLDHLLVRSGVLREPTLGRVDFVHRTVQEYLAAAQLVDDDDMELLVQNAHLDQWHEIVIMAAGHAKGPLIGKLIEGLLKRIRTEPKHSRRLKLVLAACQETLLSVPRELVAEVEQHIKDLVPPRSLAAARSLATAGGPILDRLPSNLDDLSTAAARATVRTARLVNGPRALELLTRYATDRRWRVQREVVDAWDYFDPDDYARQVLSHLLAGPVWVEVRSQQQYAALRHLPGIRKLAIWLDRMPELRWLVEHAKSLSDLTLRTSGLADLSFLYDLPPLRTVDVGRLRTVTDYSPVAVHAELAALWLHDCAGLTTIEMLPSLEGLRSLWLSGSSLACGLGDLVENLANVEFLYLPHSEWISDIAPLADLSLRELRLNGCWSVEDISPLAGQDQLEVLTLDGTSVHDLAPLEGLPKLRELWVGGIAPSADLAPLSGNRHLTVFVLHGQEIRNRHLLGRRVKAY